LEGTREALEERLVRHMGRLMADVRSLSPVQWSEAELTMPQARALVFLGHGTRRMKELSAHLRSGMPSATSMVDRLVKKGLVERVEDRSDRRVVAIRLTAAGGEVVERFLRMGRMRYEALADVLTLEELRAAVPVIEMLSRAAKRRKGANQSETEGNGSEARSAQLD
jgi:DNA-binding MarR family transcriptional regulator